MICFNPVGGQENHQGQYHYKHTGESHERASFSRPSHTQRGGQNLLRGLLLIAACNLSHERLCEAVAGFFFFIEMIGCYDIYKCELTKIALPGESSQLLCRDVTIIMGVCVYCSAELPHTSSQAAFYKRVWHRSRCGGKTRN